MQTGRLPQVGEQFLDQWLIQAEVGEGGFSRVYRATDRSGRVAALKVLTPDPAQPKLYDDDLADRFVREARVLGQLDSPYTIGLWGYGTSPEGLLYMIFEFIDGRMLFDEIKNHGALAADRVVHVLRQTLIALEAAHGHGILHRDIKPNNIMLYERDSDRDRVKLVDFGIAKMFGDEAAVPGNDLTAAGLLVGTPRYMAPEQLKGHDLTPAADLYSLGLCAIEMVSARKCIPGNDRVKIVERQIGPEQIKIPADVSVPPGLAAIVHRMTQKKLADRYTSATEVLRDLEALAGDPGATGDTVYQTVPADFGRSKPALQAPQDDDETIFETVNSAELAAFLEQQRGTDVVPGAEPSESEVDPFGNTMMGGVKAIQAVAFDDTMAASSQDLRAFGAGLGGAPQTPAPFSSQSVVDPNVEGAGWQPDAVFDPNEGRADVTAASGSGHFPQPPSAGSGQFSQPPASGSGQFPPAQGGAYGSGQFPQPPVANSHGSGQFQQPPMGGPYGSGQYQQPPMGGAYGSGQFQQPPMGSPYGSGQFPPPPMGGPYGSGQFPPPPMGAPYGSGQFQQPPMGGPHGPGQFPGPPDPRAMAPHPGGPAGLTSEDKIALGASFFVPGVGQIVAGQTAKGAVLMVVLAATMLFTWGLTWLVLMPLALFDTYCLVRAQKYRPVGAFEFFADARRR